VLSQDTIKYHPLVWIMGRAMISLSLLVGAQQTSLPRRFIPRERHGELQRRRVWLWNRGLLNLEPGILNFEL